MNIIKQILWYIFSKFLLQIANSWAGNMVVHWAILFMILGVPYLFMHQSLPVKAKDNFWWQWILKKKKVWKFWPVIICTWHTGRAGPRICKKRGPSPGGYFHRNAIRGRAAQMGRVFDKKSLNMGPIFDPQIPKHGSMKIFKKSLNMGPFFEQNP